MNWNSPPVAKVWLPQQSQMQLPAPGYGKSVTVFPDEPAAPAAPFAPLTPDEIRALDMAHLIERAYSTAYLIERPASFARVRAVISARQQGREVTRSDLNAVLSLFGKLRDVAYPKIHKSDLVYRFDVPMLVVSGPYVSADPYSGVYIEVLTPEGERAAVPLAGVTRRRKNAKA